MMFLLFFFCCVVCLRLIVVFQVQSMFLNECVRSLCDFRILLYALICVCLCMFACVCVVVYVCFCMFGCVFYWHWNELIWTKLELNLSNINFISFDIQNIAQKSVLPTQTFNSYCHARYRMLLCFSTHYKCMWKYVKTSKVFVARRDFLG